MMNFFKILTKVTLILEGVKIVAKIVEGVITSDKKDKPKVNDDKEKTDD